MLAGLKFHRRSHHQTENLIPSTDDISGDERRAGTFPPRKYRQFRWRSRNLSPPHHLPYTLDGTGLTQDDAIVYSCRLIYILAIGNGHTATAF